MSKNLVIVESPAKARTIEKFLGEDFTVKSCNGHVRDLDPKSLSIDIENNFNPLYQVLKEKQSLIKELKSEGKKAETVWLATDEDREGEAISWHLYELLGLTKDKTKRIVFHEITKNAILNAISTPRQIDTHLVNAQQGRRVLDRLVGFKLSPILWRKVKPSLSAGRVQSVAVRLIVEREREILNFELSTFYRVTAEFFTSDQKSLLKAELNKKFNSEEEAEAFVNTVKSAEFQIQSIDKKSVKKSPAPPFTTSTLQQEASRKLGYSVSQTMKYAQTLYESGHITYMRTDSMRLSNLAISSAQEQIKSEYGEKYSKTRNFTTKSKGAQEAHEAIRPTNFAALSAASGKEARLYELIWKRAIASQMADAKLEKTSVKIGISNSDLNFAATGEVIVFDGFLKVYIESSDNEDNSNNSGLIPAVQVGEKLTLNELLAIQRFTRPPARYTEASLVKKLEELGIGRPSTYAPTISTILKREYVTKDFKEGTKRSYNVLTLKNNHVSKKTLTEITGAEKGKLFPSSIGMIVNDFLVENFNEILDYNFTASVENEFDKIAEGKNEWQKMISKFYKKFEPILEETAQNAERATGERLVGKDPKTGLSVLSKVGRFGPFVQLGTKEETEKIKYAKLKKGQLIESITLEEAMKLFEMPREIGEFEGHKVIINIGRFGPYVDLNRYFVSLSKEDDPYTIQLDRAIELIKAKREKDANKYISKFEHKGKKVDVLNGRWGPYISYQKKSYRIPKGTDPKSVTLEDALEIIEKSKNTKGKSKK